MIYLVPAIGFAAGLWSCAHCEENPDHRLSPSCGLKVDETGRFHFEFSSQCAAARVVEASICAARSALGAAFLFYDAALKFIAACGGVSCFDESDWSKHFNVSSKALLRLQVHLLSAMDLSSRVELQTNGANLECPTGPTPMETSILDPREEDKGNKWSCPNNLHV